MPLIRKSSGSEPPARSGGATSLEHLASGSDGERWAAARAAVDIPGAAATLGNVIAGEANPRVREAMFTSLARIGSPQSIAVLVSLLRSDESALRTGALDALRATKGALAPHVEQLLHDPDADVRVLACELTRDLPGEDTSRLLCALIDIEPDSNVCGSALEVLAEVAGPAALPSLERCRARFAGTPFLAFSIRTIIERICSRPPPQRA